jgi:uncharacterized paraquat-inducible protein A
MFFTVVILVTVVTMVTVLLLTLSRPQNFLCRHVLIMHLLQQIKTTYFPWVLMAYNGVQSVKLSCAFQHDMCRQLTGYETIIKISIPSCSFHNVHEIMHNFPLPFIVIGKPPPKKKNENAILKRISLSLPLLIYCGRGSSSDVEEFTVHVRCDADKENSYITDE